MGLVAPLVGAWIEISFRFVVYAVIMSLPSWERGLKFLDLCQSRCIAKSLPSWERGLKFME